MSELKKLVLKKIDTVGSASIDMKYTQSYFQREDKKMCFLVEMSVFPRM